jgi:hypothetical protein
MNHLERIISNGKEILVIDYTGMTEKAMMEKLHASKEKILIENKPCLILTIFNDRNYLTPQFMAYARNETKETMHLIDRMAYVGLSQTKKLILKGYNFLFKRNFLAFDTKEEAIGYLIDNSVQNRTIPDVLKTMD